MFAKYRGSCLLATALGLGSSLTGATAGAADDVFIERGVVVKPLPKWKQRHIEKKLLRHPGNQVVIEGRTAVTAGTEVLPETKTRRAFRPLFPNLFDRRNEVVVAPPVVTTPGTIVTTPGASIVTNSAPG